MNLKILTKKPLVSLVFLWSILATQNALSYAPDHKFLKEYSARYAITFKGITVGNAQHQLKNTNNNDYYYHIKAEPSIRFLPYRYQESSSFTWSQAKLIESHNYFYDHQEGKRKKRGNVYFDYKNNMVINKTSNEPWEEKLVLPMFDKINHTLQLRYDLMHGKTKRLQYLVAEDDEVKPFKFRIIGYQKINTKLGSVDTVMLQHISRKKYKTTMWLAKKYEYMPVKIIQERKGKVAGKVEILSINQHA